jgi:hypothetical protein
VSRYGRGVGDQLDTLHPRFDFDLMSEHRKTRAPGPRGLTTLLILLTLVLACGTETPRLGDAGPRPAEIPARDTFQLGASGAVLVATGRQSFAGTLPVRCAAHDQDGLQLNLRTGDPDLPAVAVRIAEYRGSGPYRGQLFVTGRTRGGALAGSTGEVTLELQDGRAAAVDGPLVLQGSFAGTYQGAAGKGSIEGRFRGCSCPLQSDLSKLASSALAR